MRPIWSGVLSFGLINIPIKVYSATAGVEMDLRMFTKPISLQLNTSKSVKKTARIKKHGEIFIKLWKKG
jgi:DNA end-binding protein Ku